MANIIFVTTNVTPDSYEQAWIDHVTALPESHVVTNVDQFGLDLSDFTGQDVAICTNIFAPAIALDTIPIPTMSLFDSSANRLKLSSGDITVNTDAFDVVDDSSPLSGTYTTGQTTNALLTASLDVRCLTGVSAGTQIILSQQSNTAVGFVTYTPKGGELNDASSSLNARIHWGVRDPRIPSELTTSSSPSGGEELFKAAIDFLVYSANDILDNITQDDAGTTPYTGVNLKWVAYDDLDNSLINSGTVNPESDGRVGISDPLFSGKTINMVWKSADNNFQTSREYTVS
jgi:hypothetical protein